MLNLKPTEEYKQAVSLSARLKRRWGMEVRILILLFILDPLE